MIVTVVVIAVLFHLQFFAAHEVFVFGVIWLPVIYILATCCLSVWLGFDKRL